MNSLKNNAILVILTLFLLSAHSLSAQNSTNCFFDDFEPKTAIIPVAETAVKTITPPTVTVTLSTDTIGKISKYIFGNAIASWMGNVTNNTTFVNNTKTLAPTLIRYPGGSWGDIFFWNGNPGDLPDSIYDGTTGTKTKFFPISGKNDWPTTTDNYYKLRSQVNSQGLITINYGYARYGLGEKPVEKAAHLAADWVRYDKGRTKFWEIGNENAGPWEAGWMIDTAANKDGQPGIITGKLYGEHFKIFADSMRTAAAEIGATIYIGGQVLHFDGSNSWNSVDRTWNSGFFSAVGDAADFYVMHNYFGTSATVDNILSVAVTEPKKNIDFIQQDIERKNAFAKPVAITEYNINTINNNTAPLISYIDGVQAVILFNEFIKNNYGLAARWLLATGENGMFYQGSNTSLLWQARPEFYYATYTQKFTGDHVIPASSNYTEIQAYASRFASGETGIILVNKSKTTQIVTIKPGQIEIGEKYYCYSLTGGTDNGDFSLYVTVNGVAPTGTQWGPRENFENIPANEYLVEDDLIVTSPGRSVQFIMIDSGDRILASETKDVVKKTTDVLSYPNPFSTKTTIEFQLRSAATVSLEVFNAAGVKISTLLQQELFPGLHRYDFDGAALPGGIYYYKLRAGNQSVTNKMVLVK